MFKKITTMEGQSEKKILWLGTGYKSQIKKSDYSEYTLFAAITNFIENEIK